MKKAIETLLIASAVLILSSFSSEKTTSFIGTYGVCDDDPSQIQFILNEDNTFTYQDFSNPHAPVDVKGNWEIKNSHLLLTDHNALRSFHSKWKLSKKGKMIKSRNGMAFYTLRKK